MSPENTAVADLMVTGVELAADFRISDSELARLARAGVIPRIPHPTARRAYLYPLRECFRAYVAHLRSEELAARQALLEARSRREDIRTKRDQLKWEMEAGLLVRRDYILSAFEPYLISYRQAVLSRPTRLERRLSKAKSREARLKILEEDAHATLATLAEVLQSGGNGKNGSSPKKKGL